jgi:ADP-ribosyl-[dinitrogen reductase] hydrolase
MALCLANSLVTRHGFFPYDQLVRYKWWRRYGYMSATGHCFDIGEATSQSIDVFEHRQANLAKKQNIRLDQLDYLSDRRLLSKFQVYCSEPGVAGNGALMRLAPVPLFFRKHLQEAIELSGCSGQITHGDEKAYDACRYYGALIFAALNGYRKEELLDDGFYLKHQPWFGEKRLCPEIQSIAEGSYKKPGGYTEGIRGKGYIVSALEAALWAFWSDEGSFEKGVLAAVNLGDDTDTTAAIYGQLAGAYYGYKKLPKKWTDQVYARKFILNLSKWIAYEGERWTPVESLPPSTTPPRKMPRAASVENILLDSSSQSRPVPPLDTIPLRRKERSMDRLFPLADEPRPRPIPRTFTPRQYASTPMDMNGTILPNGKTRLVRTPREAPVSTDSPVAPRRRHALNRSAYRANEET